MALKRRDKFADITRKSLSDNGIAELGHVVSDGDLDFAQLVPDNDTRWNYVYAMIERALCLKEQLNLFCASCHARETVSRVFPKMMN